MEKAEEEKTEKARKAERERLRREYFESQRRNIIQYKKQKQKTDELLLIPRN